MQDRVLPKSAEKGGLDDGDENEMKHGSQTSVGRPAAMTAFLLVRHTHRLAAEMDPKVEKMTADARRCGVESWTSTLARLI